MAFPETVLPIVVQLQLAGAWTDVTSYVRRDEPNLIQITPRGKSEDATYPDPTSCTMKFDNTDGRFSPRNPLSPYYGLLGRNTPIRVAVRGIESTYLEVYDSKNDQAAAPDSAALSITGDIDVRVDLRLDDWVLNFNEILGKWGDTGNQRGWSLALNSGLPLLSWSTAGTGATIVTAQSATRVTPPSSGRMALRATLDVNNGAGGWTAVFYTAPTIAGPWTQLGSTVTGTGTTSIFDNTSPVEIGNIFDGYSDDRRKRIYAAEIRSGIGGTVVASPDFTAQTPGATAFSDAQGNVWTMNGAAELTDRAYRFYGEVPAWPPQWDPSGKDVTVSIQASGIMRRLQQGSSPVSSTLYRGIINDSDVIAYWPCEDGENATVISSATPGGKAMAIVGTPEFGAFSGFPSSKPIPTLSDAQLTGVIPSYTSTGAIQVRFILDVPTDTATTAGQSICAVTTSGTANLWHLSYQASGGMKLEFFNTSTDGSPSLGDSGVVAFDMNGTSRMVSVELEQSGSDIDWQVTTVDGGGGLSANGTLTDQTLGKAASVIINNGGGIEDFSVGHVNVRSSIAGIFDLFFQLTGYDGEGAGARIARLCSEQGVPVTFKGDPYSSTAVGPQRIDTFINLIRECADANYGQLYEPRDMFGLGYRVREDLYNQTPAVTLDYTNAELAGDFSPTDDDRLTRNDVTVTRTNGGSYRAVDTDSALSVLPPPDGVGQYDTEYTLNLHQDDDTRDQAGFRLHVGTIDEPRYPSITVDLSRREITSNTALREALVAADIGDVLNVEHMPAWMPPNDVSQLLLGYDETLGNKEHKLSFRGAPASAYTVGTYDADRYDMAGSELAAPAPEVPAFVDSDAAFLNASSIPVPAIDAPTVVACLAWNTTATLTAPAGWTQQDTTLTGTSSGSAVYAARGDVADWTFTLSATSKTVVIVLGYSESEVSAADGALDAGSDGVHEAPALTVPDGPARLVRFYWDKTTGTTGWTAGDAGATGRETQIGTGTGTTSMFATDQVVSAGTAPSASATANATANQAGGFSLALFSTVEPADDVSETDTTLSVATTLGPLWTTAAGDFPFDVVCGGEVMTVTAISGTTSPQAFTVTRAVNGISKAHSAGEAVSLATPAYRAL